MDIKANVKLIVILALLALIVWFVAFPRPRVLPNGSQGSFSLVQVYGMQFADGRIESLYSSEKEEMDMPLQTSSGGCRSATKMKAIGARLSGDSQQITTWARLGYPSRAGKYAAYAATLAAKAKAFQSQSENCDG